MEKEHDSEAVIRRYLLGDISEEEREQVEQKMLTDGEYFSQISVLEEELVDAYVSQRLSADEQKKFEYYFLSNPQGIEQVRLAKGLRDHALKRRPIESTRPGVYKAEPAVKRNYLRSKISVSGYALAIAAIILVFAGFWLAASLRSLQNQVASLRALPPGTTAREQELQQQLAEQQARNTTLEEDLKREQDQKARLEQELVALKGSQSNPQSRNALASLLIAPGRIRAGSKDNIIVIQPSVERALFQLILRNAEYDSFRASLKKDDGQSVWTSGSLKAQTLGQRSVVQVSLPASLLSESDFFFELQGASGDGSYEAVGNYYFKVSKK